VIWIPIKEKSGRDPKLRGVPRLEFAPVFITLQRRAADLGFQLKLLAQLFINDVAGACVMAVSRKIMTVWNPRSKLPFFVSADEVD
jgi:hypothetical protein